MSLDPKIEKLLEEKNIKGLIKALRNKSLLDDAVKALAEIGDEAIKKIIKNFSGFSANLPSVYALALAKIGNPAVEPLLEVLRKKRSAIRDERRQACIALGMIGDKRALGTLCWARRKESTMTGAKEFIIPAILKIAKPPYLELLQILDDDDKPTRFGAIDTLWDIASKDGLDANAIESLSKALQDPGATFRQSAAYCLGWIYDERVTEPLSNALNDNSMFVRDMARSSLKRVLHKLLDLNPDQTLNSCEKWINDPHKWFRKFAIKNLNSIIKKYPKKTPLEENEIKIVEKIFQLIEILMDEQEKDIQKQLSSLLSDISKKNQDIVYQFLLKHADSNNINTKMIIKKGMKKLSKNYKQELLTRIK